MGKRVVVEWRALSSRIRAGARNVSLGAPRILVLQRHSRTDYGTTSARDPGRGNHDTLFICRYHPCPALDAQYAGLRRR